jgi:hypothetical protein
VSHFSTGFLKTSDRHTIRPAFTEGTNGLKKDFREAVKWYLKAEKCKDYPTGYSWAEFNLGNCYLNGIGVEKNSGTAIEWLRKAQKNADDKFLQWQIANLLKQAQGPDSTEVSKPVENGVKH